MSPVVLALACFASAAVFDIVYTSLVASIQARLVLRPALLSAALGYIGSVGVYAVPLHPWTVHFLVAGYFTGTLLTMLVARWRRGRGGP